MNRSDAHQAPATPELLADLRTPYRVQRWMRRLRYNHESDITPSHSFFGVFERSTANCFEGAVAAAYVLEHHAYPPLLLYLDSEDDIAHIVFPFRQRGRWGAVGKSRYPALMGRRPIFRSVRDLAWSYVDPFVDTTGRVLSYAILDLRTVRGRDWRSDRLSLRRLDRALDAAPMHPLRTSDRRHESARRKYLKWKEQHPGIEPPIALYRGAPFMW
jgi:hypothetical protein